MHLREKKVMMTMNSFLKGLNSVSFKKYFSGQLLIKSADNILATFLLLSLHVLAAAGLKMQQRDLSCNI